MICLYELCVAVCVCMWQVHVCAGVLAAQSIRSPETGFAGPVVESGVLETNMGPLAKQKVLFHS